MSDYIAHQFNEASADMAKAAGGPNGSLPFREAEDILHKLQEKITGDTGLRIAAALETIAAGQEFPVEVERANVVTEALGLGKLKREAPEHG